MRRRWCCVHLASISSCSLFQRDYEFRPATRGGGRRHLWAPTGIEGIHHHFGRAAIAQSGDQILHDYRALVGIAHGWGRRKVYVPGPTAQPAGVAHAHRDSVHASWAPVHAIEGFTRRRPCLEAGRRMEESAVAVLEPVSPLRRARRGQVPPRIAGGIPMVSDHSCTVNKFHAAI